jgi:heme-degrading monooxygenase HmoA
MHARLVRVKGSPEGAAQRRAVFEQEVVPVMRAQPGFVGVVAIADPDTGAAAMATYWESEEALNRSAGALADLRDRMTAVQTLEPLSLEQYEVILMERRGAPAPGNAVRLSRATGNADAAGEALAQLREGVALASTLAGFRAFVAGVDRSTGRYFVATGWETASDREAAEEVTAEQRARLAERIGATALEVERYEVLVAAMPAKVTGS